MKSENMLDLDLNEVPNTNNELISSDFVPMQVNDLGTSVYANVESNETDLDSTEVDCVDSDGYEDLDDEDAVRILISLSQEKMDGERNVYFDSKDMKCGEAADGTNYGEKRTGKKKDKETSIDGEFEGTSRFKRRKNIDASKKFIGSTKGQSDIPLKVQGKSGPSKVIGSNKLKKPGLKKNDVKPLPKIAITSSFKDSSESRKEGSSSDHQAKKIVLKRPNNKEDKPEAMRKSTQKQLLKDRIKEMLISAGWTIKLRPRNGNEHYCDAVYASPKGKVYWSITLAYKTLKKEVENGEADSRAVSAFVPIPENEWNSLLRISKKK